MQSIGGVVHVGGITVHQGDSLGLYQGWPTPTLIISDGPYGVGGFDGDLRTANKLGDWYKPHVEKWTNCASPQTTLWFWNSELGWAEAHSVLRAYGWRYRSCCVWNKGISHLAGRTNTRTLRMLMPVTEVCVHYVREGEFRLPEETTTVQDWMRREWHRTGLPFKAANKACGVTDAATRKYLTGDSLWYFPPPDMFQRLVEYANVHGNPVGRPYFCVNGRVLKASDMTRLRAVFHLETGITNVWDEPPVRGDERVKSNSGKIAHPNQKPVKLMERIVALSTNPGDVVWEPFGGLFTGVIAADHLGRRGVGAEIDRATFDLGVQRIRDGLQCESSSR